MERLILGEGLLGKALGNLTGGHCISRKRLKFDFVDINSYKSFLSGYDEVINCIGCTDTYDEDKTNNWNINYLGVVDLVDYLASQNIKLIHISTDYVYSNSVPNASESDVPVHCANWYGYTKLLSDAYVQLKSPSYLLLRGTHRETPFPYSKAFVNQIGNFCYVDDMAKLIRDVIQTGATGVYNMGNSLKTVYDLAKETKPDVVPANETVNETMPLDVSMNMTKLKDLLDV